MHSLEKEIITHMARALFVSTYATAWDTGDLATLTAEAAGYRVTELAPEDVTDPEPGKKYFELTHPDHPNEWSESLFDDEGDAWDAALDHGNIHIPYASGGSDWMDAAPETPEDCLLICAMEVGAWMQHTRDYFRAQGAEKYISLLGYLHAAALADGLLEGDPKNQDDYIDQLHTQLGNLTAGRHDQFSYAESFGHNLGMMWMGEGVGWFDDHEEFDLPSWNGLEHKCDLIELGFEPRKFLEAIR